MIKTLVYNEFDFPSYSLDKESVESALGEIKDFIQNGGNLNHPVKDGDSFSSAFKYLEDRLGEENITSLFEKNYLESPGNWKFDIDQKAIIESPLYHSYWYRDNASKYRTIISEGFRTVCKEYLSNPIYESYHYSEHYNSAPNNIVKNNNHPLLAILLRIPLQEMVQIFIDEVPEAKLLLNEIHFRSIPYYDSLLKNKDPENILNLFFKNNIIDLNILLGKYDFQDVIKTAISQEDYDFINLLKNKSDNPLFLGDLDKDNNMDSSFLRRANSPAMAKLLIDSGCPIIKNNSQYDSLLFSYQSFPEHKLDTIEFIMEYVPLDYMGEYKNIFWQYLSNSRDLNYFKNFAKFIVSKGFPLEEYDLLNICPGNDITDKIKTCIELGANLNNCADYIQKLVRNRDTSTFKAVQKTKLVDLYSPDNTYHLLHAESHTKGTLDLLDKAENSKINSMTELGKPAWFGANSRDTIHKILNKIDSFNQLDSSGHNWLTHYYSLLKKDKHNIANIVLEMAAKEEDKTKRLLVLSQKDDTSNLLHHGFKFNTYNRELRDEFVSIVKAFDTTNLNDLIGGLDEKGLFPTDYLIQSKENEDAWNKSFWDVKFDTLLKMAEYNLDYDKKNINGLSLIDSIRNFYLIDNKLEQFIEPVEKAYSRYKLFIKLDDKLIADNRKNPKIKI